MVRAKHLLEGWRSANHKQQSSSHTSTLADTDSQLQNNPTGNNRNNQFEWRKPKSGQLKYNADVFFSNSSNKVGISICTRDAGGQHVLSKTMWFTPLCSVDIEEVLGLIM